MGCVIYRSRRRGGWYINFTDDVVGRATEGFELELGDDSDVYLHFKVGYSYARLQNVDNVLNEVKDPVRTLKKVVSAALATACSLYLLVNCAYLAVVQLKK